MSDSTFETKKIEGAPTAPARAAAASPSSVVVSFDVDAGAIATPTTAARSARQDAILAKAQARLDAARGGGEEATQIDEHGAPIPPAAEEGADAEPGAAAEDAGDDQVDGDEPEGDAAEPDAEPEGEAAEDEPAEPDPATPAAPAADVAVRLELEQARGQLAEAERALAEYANAHRPEEFETFYTKPVDWLKTKIAAVLGVESDDPAVQEEAVALLGEWTWGTISAQDLPQQQQAQLRTDRTDRKIRLDTHRRQAERTATQVSKQEAEARTLIRTVLDAGKDQFPALSLATLRHGRPLEAVVHDRLLRGIREGAIQDWDKRPITELIAEAARLVDTDSRTWAQHIGPQLAHLIPPASAPVAPGASARSNATQKPAPSQATPKPGTTVKPRTLSKQKAGAAPSRPGAPKTAEPLPRDPEARAAEVIRRHTSRR